MVCRTESSSVSGCSSVFGDRTTCGGPHRGSTLRGSKLRGSNCAGRTEPSRQDQLLADEGQQFCVPSRDGEDPTSISPTQPFEVPPMEVGTGVETVQHHDRP